MEVLSALAWAVEKKNQIASGGKDKEKAWRKTRHKIQNKDPALKSAKKIL
ncbi:Uncharacterised protein [uncultured archaeon]|nr:Uncharacterised protein [uncultured archaeon]